LLLEDIIEDREWEIGIGVNSDGVSHNASLHTQAAINKLRRLL